MKHLFLIIFIVVCLPVISFSQERLPSPSSVGGVTESVTVTSSTAWSVVSPTVPRGLVVNVPAGASSTVCFTRDNRQCSSILEVTACPIIIAAGASFEFLVSEDLWTGQVCGRRLSGSGSISVGINRW